MAGRLPISMGGAPEFRLPFFGPDSLRFALASFPHSTGIFRTSEMSFARQDSVPEPGISETRRPRPLTKAAVPRISSPILTLELQREFSAIAGDHEPGSKPASSAHSDYF